MNIIKSDVNALNKYLNGEFNKYASECREIAKTLEEINIECIDADRYDCYDRNFDSEYYRLTKIPDDISRIWFAYSKLTHIEINVPLKILPGGAFAYCFHLHTIILPKDSIKIIEDMCFSNCPQIIEITIPDSVEEIGEKVFENCMSLSKIHLSNNLRIIKEYCFHNCYSIEEIVIPNSVEEIENDCFRGCISLHNITLPTSLKVLDDGLFTSTNIKELYVPPNVTFAKRYAFEEMYKVEKIHLPKHIILGPTDDRNVLENEVPWDDESLMEKFIYYE